MSVNVLQTVDAEIKMDFNLSSQRPVKRCSNYQDEYDLLWQLSDDLIAWGLTNLDHSSKKGVARISTISKGIQAMYETMKKSEKYKNLLKKFNLELIKVK